MQREERKRCEKEKEGIGFDVVEERIQMQTLYIFILFRAFEAYDHSSEFESKR